MESKEVGNTIGKNSEFVANMERVLDVYKRLYDSNLPVICMHARPFR